jgi:predicted PurR-regulated permease PerM
MRISEQAVFRWVVIVVIAAASVIALSLLTRPLVGALWGLALLGAAAWHCYRWLERRRARS